MKERSYNWITGIVSAASITQALTDNFKLSEDALIKRAKAAIQLNNPARPRYDTAFDITVAFKHIHTMPYNHIMSLDLLRQKLVFLVKINTMWRDSDFARVTRDANCVILADNWFEIRRFWPKEQKIKRAAKYSR